MSHIPYMEELSPRRNMAILRSHLGISNKDIAQRENLNVGSMNNIIANNFLTGSGKETEITRAVKSIIQTYFSTPIPNVIKVKKIDLFEMMGCASCQYRSRGHKGCIKFSFTREEINSGPYITTLEHGAFSLRPGKLCPHAKASV